MFANWNPNTNIATHDTNIATYDIPTHLQYSDTINTSYKYVTLEEVALRNCLPQAGGLKSLRNAG